MAWCSRLEGIARGGEDGGMELAFFLLDGIDLSRVVALKKGAAHVDQIKLALQGVLRCCPEHGQSQHGYEQVCKYASAHRVSGSIV
jgi:hypothetical protein